MTSRNAPTMPPPATLSSDLLAKAKSKRDMAARLIAEAEELEKAAAR